MIRSNIRKNKKTYLRGAYEAPRTKRNRNRQINERWPTNAGAPLRDDAPDHQQTKTEKQKIPTTTPQAAIRQSKKETDTHDRNRRKGLQNSDWNKSRQQSKPN